MKKTLSILMLLSVVSISIAQQNSCISGDCDNGYGAWVYKNGDKYEGTWVNKQMHGNGTYLYANGDIYKGDFKNNKLEGTGTFVSHSGDKYVGQYVNNMAEGEGTYFYLNGKVEKGLFLKGEYVGDLNKTGCVSGDCKNGKGTYILDNGEKYFGEMKNYSREGKGTYYFNSGEWYKGEWKKNQREGQGTNYFPDGEKYVGNWKNDKRHGYGTHTYLDGTERTGMWEMGRYVGTGNNNYGCISGNCDNGFGVYRWSDGEKYVGTFKNKLRYGKGTNYWPDGKVYEGVWFNDKMHGYGKESKDGNVINVGFWEAGKYQGETFAKAGCISGNCVDGYGTLILKTGDRYIGQFKNGNFNGYGTMDFIKGARYEGEFKDGKFDGEGNLVVQDKGKYIGDFANGAFNGIGTFYYEDGRTVSGKWANNNFSGSAQAGLKAPTVVWHSPATASLTITSIDYVIRLCISSKEEPQNVQVFVNDELKVNNAVSGLKRSSSGCDYAFERMLNLRPGENNIKVIVKNGAGETTSEIRKVIYDSNTTKLTKRYALIIGNSAYQMGPLRNPKNDANAMAAELKELGFDVSVYVDQGQEDMKQRIREFGDKITANKGVGLFFFAGHGLQVGGENYIIPVDAHIAKFADIETEAVNLNRITGEM
ncbi:MAG: caspase family protein, partial [Bacteroidales bacterium]|nr:caspase family protein [Bacteroidales bacterium]